MGVDQYHEPPDELSAAIRTFARMITGLAEEADAISWYEQRMSGRRHPEAKNIMENAQKEEKEPFSMDLEFLLRTKLQWREVARGILFSKGDIVELAEKAEKEAD